MALPFFFGLFRFVGLLVRRPCPVIILACLEAAWLLRHDGALQVRAVMAVSPTCTPTVRHFSQLRRLWAPAFYY